MATQLTSTEVDLELQEAWTRMSDLSWGKLRQDHNDLIGLSITTMNSIMELMNCHMQNPEEVVDPHGLPPSDALPKLLGLILKVKEERWPRGEYYGQDDLWELYKETRVLFSYPQTIGHKLYVNYIASASGLILLVHFTGPNEHLSAKQPELFKALDQIDVIWSKIYNPAD
jgi:hypothetical protein